MPGVTSKEKFRLQLKRKNIPESNSLRLNYLVNTDNEDVAGLWCAVTKYVATSTHYDCDIGLSAGFTIIF